MHHNVHFSKCYVTVRPACLAESKANATWIFFLLPLISAETSWFELFVLVSHDGSKHHQLYSISLSSCHSLPFFDTFYSKVGLNFRIRGGICQNHGLNRVLLFCSCPQTKTKELFTISFYKSLFNSSSIQELLFTYFGGIFVLSKKTKPSKLTDEHCGTQKKQLINRGVFFEKKWVEV